ncbi:DEAD/DEAH box helicase, partial [Arthrobacter sp. RIT-PI-e]|uniref:Lhr family ATP-dependent helicase n=1 Tax=Arthrobacter sp. RIT-PI-e TaxID=1681197 RepID=UPI0006A13F79
ELELQRLKPDRLARGLEGVADLLRLLGPLTVEEITQRLEAPAEQTAALAAPVSAATLVEPVLIDGSDRSAGPGHAAGAQVDEDVAADASDDPTDEELLAASEAAQAPDPGRASPETVRQHVTALVKSNRALVVNIAGVERVSAVEDAARLRDAIGVPLPMGIPLAFIEPVADPLGDLVGRYARTHGPFTAAEAASRLGLGVAGAAGALRRLAGAGRVVVGVVRPSAAPPGPAPPARPGAAPGPIPVRPPASSEWCDAEVLRRLRRRSLAALRQEVEPVDPTAYGRFLPAWQHIGSNLRGPDGVITEIDQLPGVPAPASAREPLIPAQRVAHYAPAMLDELTATGEVLWSGAGSLAGNDGWIALPLAENASLTLRPDPTFEPSALHTALLDALSGGGGYFLRQLTNLLDVQEPAPDAAVVTALWDLVWAGRISNDTFTPVRSLLASGRTAHKQKAVPARARTSRTGRLGRAPGKSLTGASMRLSAEGDAGAGYQRPTPLLAAGRWNMLPATEAETTLHAHAQAELLLDRYGVVTRGAVGNEGIPGGFGLMNKALARLEEMGRGRRGDSIEQPGAAQSAAPATVDRLRSFSADNQLPTAQDVLGGGGPPPKAVALAAPAPAHPYGSALAGPRADGGHRAGRKAGALVVLVDGALSLYVERGGKTLLTFTEDADVLRAAALALVTVIRRGAADKMALEKVNGGGILDTDIGRALADAGFHTTPKGLRIRA